MSSLTSFSLLCVLFALVLQASSRPQDLNSDAEDFGEFVVPSEKQGFIIGDITVFSDHVNVDRPKKKPPPPEEAKGPRTLALVTGPEEGQVGVASAASPGISISGASITFNRPARVEEV
ncbi:uncharacterized protein LOC134782040 [Penaeus indicus]|uniref:uncharacterized protein LOC134782040 n=1 Tax=Penaeus indicus TaxID=29960 RepID=UPI00300D0C5C